MPKQTIVIATENRAKGKEMSSILESLVGDVFTVITLADLPGSIVLPDEVGESFAEIAAAKAMAVTKSTGLPSIGDDSGLCVDALNGAPGIRSRRWVPNAESDEERNRALVLALHGFPAPWTAHFVTSVAYIALDQSPTIATGTCDGAVINTPRGSNGFGYDPIFEVSGLGLTMAELTADEKHSISHRASAIKGLVAKLGWD